MSFWLLFLYNCIVAWPRLQINEKEAGDDHLKNILRNIGNSKNSFASIDLSSLRCDSKPSSFRLDSKPSSFVSRRDSSQRRKPKRSSFVNVTAEAMQKLSLNRMNSVSASGFQNTSSQRRQQVVRGSAVVELRQRVTLPISSFKSLPLPW